MSEIPSWAMTYVNDNKSTNDTLTYAKMRVLMEKVDEAMKQIPKPDFTDIVCTRAQFERFRETMQAEYPVVEQEGTPGTSMFAWMCGVRVHVVETEAAMEAKKWFLHIVEGRQVAILNG